MKTICLVVLIILGALALRSHAAQTIKNDRVINISLSTTTASFLQVIDLRQADSASFQMTETCAKGQTKIQQSNDGVNWVDINVANSSMTFYGGSTTTISNQLFSIGFIPAYSYAQFSVTNTSAPAAGIAQPCNLTVTECIKSATVESN